jgi:hypothetical protein
VRIGFSGSGEGTVADSSKQGNVRSGSIKGGEFPD